MYNSCSFKCFHRFEPDFEYPALINLDGNGYFTHSPLRSMADCPVTHYGCTSQPQLCLPGYTRCNGYYDCAGGEDEMDCHNYTCPGLYRCRGSAACLHSNFLCDGMPQCPRHDDEWLCGQAPCPESCQCLGLAFVCNAPFSPAAFPSLRYVDGSGSRMEITDFRSNHYIVRLILRECALKSLRVASLPNIRFLDLSSNELHSVSMDAFLVLENLKVLSLSNNPLRQLTSESTRQQTVLRTLLLADTFIETFNSTALVNFIGLQSLNLSGATIHTIEKVGFQEMLSLVELDLTGYPVKAEFPPDIFYDLKELRKIVVDNYKLCCPKVLPDHFDKNFCEAPQNEISSCDDLLRSGTYRGFLWLMSVLSVTANAFCFVFRTVKVNRFKGAFNVLVSNLCVADFLMGVYVTIIGVADWVFEGRYLHNDLVWTRSKACKTAGFLFLLSSEVSALTILLITIDRFIVLSFPFSRLRFGRFSASVACLASWCIGVVLAAVPLLPATSH
jgi:hypothetical protein